MTSIAGTPDVRPAQDTAVRRGTVRAASRLRSGRLVALGMLVLAIAALAVIRWWPNLFPPPEPDRIVASGRVEGRETTVAPKDIQGRVVRILADEGETVTAGQQLAELAVAPLDARRAAAAATVSTLDAQIAQARLDVTYTARTIQAAIRAAEAALAAAHAHAEKARAIKANSDAMYKRAAVLLPAGAISRQELDVAETTLRTSEADAAAAETEVARAEAELARARATQDTIGLKRQAVRALEETRAAAAGQLHEVDAMLAERRILAPIDGTVTSRSVEPGDVVSPGTPMFRIVDMSRLYLKVYVPEPQIARVRLGERAAVTVDGFPQRRFNARVSRISQQAEFTPKNVETTEERVKLVFGVELALDNAERLLKPGMPADCVIEWRAAGNRDVR